VRRKIAVPNRIDRQIVINVILILLLLATGTYAFIHFDLSAYFLQKERAIALIRSYHPYDEVVFIALQILQVALAPIPGEFTGIIGGYLFGPLLGTIYSTIGLTIGSWLAFVIARIFGLPLVERIVKPETIRKYDYALEHQGVLISFVLFLIPGFPKDCLCYILGLSHMKTWKFLIISTIGRLLGTVMLSVGGGLARNDNYKTVLIISIVCVVFVVLSYIYRDKWLENLKKGKAEGQD
jgi:uncharacterized membrane protein YdjX (TVP38/TMEM64 family)